MLTYTAKLLPNIVEQYCLSVLYKGSILTFYITFEKFTKAFIRLFIASQQFGYSQTEPKPIDYKEPSCLPKTHLTLAQSSRFRLDRGLHVVIPLPPMEIMHQIVALPAFQGVVSLLESRSIRTQSPMKPRTLRPARIVIGQFPPMWCFVLFSLTQCR